MSLSLAVLALFAPMTPQASVETPVVIAERLLTASQQEDWPSALAMLTGHALFGIGHVGGPLNAETVSILGKFEENGCRRVGIRETNEKDDGHPNIRFVELRRMCPYGAESGKTGEHEMTTTIFVEGGKIAGYYVH